MPEGDSSDFGPRFVVPVVSLVVLWVWETLRPFFAFAGRERLRHGVRNLSVALVNALVLFALLATATASVAQWARSHEVGLLHQLGLPAPLRLPLALLLLDLWTYLWHRANHRLPLLWRFHRMHHSDNQMDVTTATRFHLGEHLLSFVLRTALVPLLGVRLWELVAYDACLVVLTQFHHANVSLGRGDRWGRALIVTPNMHKVHHSRLPLETHSNFSAVFSFWDRLFATFRMREEFQTLQFGLDEFAGPSWQTLWGMVKTPFVQTRQPSGAAKTQGGSQP